MHIYSSITEIIGQTPLVRLQNLPRHQGCTADILLKLESFNPAKSVKERIAISMIEEAERAGLIEPGVSTIVEASSGNTGIGLAMVCAAKGYRLIITMPENMSRERQQLIRAYGAQILTTPAEKDMKGAIALANELLATVPHAFSPQQFSNPANPKIHYETTGVEIWQQTEGKVDILVLGVGTGGTLTGAGQYLKQQKPSLQIVAVEPAESAVLSGGAPGVHPIQGIGPGFIPDVLRVDLIDEIVTVTAGDAGAIARQLALQEGIVSGISTGAAVQGALLVGSLPENQDKLIVTLQASGGERYLSTPLFQV